jgi:hypothetical protein
MLVSVDGATMRASAAATPIARNIAFLFITLHRTEY